MYGRMQSLQAKALADADMVRGGEELPAMAELFQDDEAFESDLLQSMTYEVFGHSCVSLWLIVVAQRTSSVFSGEGLCLSALIQQPC